jgi:hypothetical protein
MRLGFCRRLFQLSINIILQIIGDISGKGKLAKMDVEEFDIGIPALNSEGGKFQWTWIIEFATAINGSRVTEVSGMLTDSWINVAGSTQLAKQAAITIQTAQPVDYAEFWDNSFRVMLLLDKLLARIEKIEHRERSHWRRFLAQADHEGTLDRYRTPLMLAARKGDKEKVLDETCKSRDIDERSFSGKTPLMYAAQYGHIDIVRFLLSKGATVQLSDPEWTPLQLAILSRSVEITRLFLDAGTDINAQNYYGTTALMSVAGAGVADLVELLLDRGASVHITDKEGLSVQDWAAKALKSVYSKDQYGAIESMLRDFSN